jgi:hypothetical protein
VTVIIIHRVIDGKRHQPVTPTPPTAAPSKPKYATQLLAKGNRLLKGSGLVLRDWGDELTPACKRYFLEDESGDDWALIPDLPAYVAELEGTSHG